jgi:hypothetical protein
MTFGIGSGLSNCSAGHCDGRVRPQRCIRRLLATIHIVVLLLLLLLRMLRMRWSRMRLE